MTYLFNKHASTSGLVRLSSLVLLVAVALVPSASADTQCTSGSLSDIVNTTCDIGTLEFSFGNFTGANRYYDSTLGTITVPWSASDFTFAPLADGFSLEFLPGAQQAQSPFTGPNALDYGDLSFCLTSLSGPGLYSVGVSGGALSAAGLQNPNGTDSSFAEAGYGNFINTSNGQMYGSSYVQEAGGTVTTGYLQQYNGAPLSTGCGYVNPFYLSASGGTYSGQYSTAG
jgi:hypothetical protein